MVIKQRGRSGQSAMEYLMTYGWAILVIAVVLAVLFQLGVFSGGNFTPAAQAGSCEVQMTAAGSSLVGECQGQLPEYVGSMTGSGYITVGTASNLNLVGSLTVSAWVNLKSIENAAIYDQNHCNSQYEMYFDNVGPYFNMEVANSLGSYWAQDKTSYPTNTWIFVTGTFDGSLAKTYVNGVQEGTPSGVSGPLVGHSGGTGYIGYLNGCGYDFKGYMANVQLYNTSLSTSEILALYQEGIGGAPVRPQNLVGWWPLNGNMNDYSGNNNNGQIVGSGVSYTSSWQSGYTAP